MAPGDQVLHCPIALHWSGKPSTGLWRSAFPSPGAEFTPALTLSGDHSPTLPIVCTLQRLHLALNPQATQERGEGCKLSRGSEGESPWGTSSYNHHSLQKQ